MESHRRVVPEANKVHFVWDWRSFGRQSLLSPEMARWQGPCFLARSPEVGLFLGVRLVERGTKGKLVPILGVPNFKTRSGLAWRIGFDLDS